MMMQFSYAEDMTSSFLVGFTKARASRLNPEMVRGRFNALKRGRRQGNRSRPVRHACRVNKDRARRATGGTGLGVQQA
ncbi:hypothetical protein AGR7C_Lc220036 [Agrobacterium deltaense Zutra 3/1]|uniref:Uncharacterized protein n=1 Tax=Agrobacterium deltaense Zutra 3/1 TaxID=1183427 RepID=A0A1S7RRP2_9HYPH|nr:hypothetical protein AGR7C_Lc220036 [Agrobacterium deltaense Zutra 3/1]